jgi:hypothetical protein
MPLPKLELRKERYRIYKTGVVFYDAARLIGAAHFFFGTASAEIKDKGAYWEIGGIQVRRDEEQIIWALERLSLTDTERRLYYKNDSFNWATFLEFFSEPYPTHRKGRKEKLKAEYDAALQIATRGFDPLNKYEVLAPRSTGETKKQFKDFFQEVAVATLGRSFAARVVSRSKRQTDEIYILPIFQEHFVLSGFLDYQRFFNHSGGGRVAAIFASLSILLDLIGKNLPVRDFVYTREVKGPARQPIFSGSGYLGLERLCNIWWKAVQEHNEGIINLLSNIRYLLDQTRHSNTDEQVQSLTRWVADFVSNPTVDALMMIERLKARIRATSQAQNIHGSYAANHFLNKNDLIKEVKNMLQSNLPETPWQVSEALARALGFDEKGWMNQFTRLENSANFSQFIQQVEHIVSRGYYREQQEKGQTPNIRDALTRARDLAKSLREMSISLQDEKSFRAWKAIFLLDILSRARFRGEERGQSNASTSVQ